MPKKATRRSRVDHSGKAGGGQPRRSTVRTTRGKKAQLQLPIVGIGASAGGLEALQGLLGKMPADCGMSFVVVQHQDPTRDGMLAELLQRCTKLEVSEITDQTAVKRNHVYVIPPNKDLSIYHGVLHLLEPAAPHGLRLPIDFFLRSLALDQGPRAAAVILSGMGSDGTQGVRVIKEHGGVILVQSPDSAKYGAMPSSVLNAGLADVVAHIEELAGKLTTILHQGVCPVTTERLLEDKTLTALDKIALLLRSRSGFDFSQYKKNTVFRRVERRMHLHQLDSLQAYIQVLQQTPEELDLLFKELLIGVTSFFRDSAVWETLRTQLLPALLARRANGTVLRAWVPGCSTGEEAFTLAICFSECAAKLQPDRRLTLQVFASDLDRDAINKARQGLYPEGIVADVPPDLLSRYFTKEENGYRVSKEIREQVVFAQQNVIMDPPFTKLDLLSCRNLLIYMEPVLQRRLIPLFHFCLKPGGLLLLGNSESLGSFGHLFDANHAKLRLFQRTDTPAVLGPLDFPSSFMASRADEQEGRGKARAGTGFQAMAEQFLLQQIAPAAVLTTEQGDILFVNGRTGSFLEPATGKTNWNIFAMARKGLRYELADAFHKAQRHKSRVLVRDLRVSLGAETILAHLDVQPVSEPEGLKGCMLVVFGESPLSSLAPEPEGKTGGSKARRLEQRLKEAEQELQRMHTQMLLSQEELRATIEELQSTNEELQSTNEELTTSKEEMQSLNEELQTVNAELQLKVEELSHVNNDMQNLLNSTDVATIFLDNELNIRRFTTRATKIIRLIPGDIGRPITDLASSVLYPELQEDARRVLNTLVVVEKQISTKEERWFAIRILPYRTITDQIDGVVITFTDITSHRLGAEARKATNHP